MLIGAAVVVLRVAGFFSVVGVPGVGNDAGDVTDHVILSLDCHASVRFDVVAGDAGVSGVVHEHERVDRVVALHGAEFDAPHVLEFCIACDADVRDRVR